MNGAVLTDRDLLREMYAIFPYAKQHGGGFPKEMEPDIRRGALKMIEFEELVYQDASPPAHDHCAGTPGRVGEAIPRPVRDRTNSTSTFLQSEAHGSEQVLQSKIKRSLLIEDYLKEQIKTKPRSAQRKRKLFIRTTPTASKCRNSTPSRPSPSCRRGRRAPSPPRRRW